MRLGVDMFGNCKYIVIDGSIPILFPNSIRHNFIANSFGIDRVTSAGFVEVSQDLEKEKIVVRVFGDSVGLRKSSKEVDSFLIKKMLED